MKPKSIEKLYELPNNDTSFISLLLKFLVALPYLNE